MAEIIKRPLNLDEKLAVLIDLANPNGSKLSYIAERFGVGMPDIVKIEIERPKIHELVTSAYFNAGEEMPLRNGKNPRLENILYAWFMQESTTRWLTNRIIRYKALEIHAILNENSKPFKASEGWMTAFKARYKIDMMAHYRERATVGRQNVANNYSTTEKLVALEITPVETEFQPDQSPIFEVSFICFKYNTTSIDHRINNTVLLH